MQWGPKEGRKWSVLLGWNKPRKAHGGGDLKQCLENSRDICQAGEAGLSREARHAPRCGEQVGKAWWGDIVWCVCNCGFQEGGRAQRDKCHMESWMESRARSPTPLCITLKSLFSFIYLINPYIENLLNARPLGDKTHFCCCCSHGGRGTEGADRH